MLSVEGLHVAYGRTEVVTGVSLEVPADGLLCLMGRNGVGKTTLLNAVTGILAVRAGRVRLEGRDITDLAPQQRVAMGLGYVPQGHETFPYLTVRENLLVVHEAGRRRGPSGLDDALDLFPRLRPLLGRRAGLLSGGQQQQLAIARALVARPRLLLLDEPTEGIQPSIITEIEEAIGHLRRSTSMSILLVEQYVDFALRLADRYVVLDAGEVASAGSIAELTDAQVRELLSV